MLVWEYTMRPCIPSLIAALLTVGGLMAGEVPDVPAWTLSQPIYEAQVERCSPEGTFRGFQARLPALKDLGIGIIWLMPIFPRGGNPPDRPRSDSPYCVRDYRAVNPAYGTIEDLRALVTATHDLGMHLIIDWVPNHTAFGNPLTGTHPDFYQRDGSGRIKQAGGWSDVAQLDHGNRATWDYMFAARRFWVQTCGIDGFREDVAGALPDAYWRELRLALATLKPVFLLSEADKPGHHPSFDATYDWTSQVYFYQIVRGVWPARSLDRLLEWEAKRFPAGARRMRHLTNHDMAGDGYAWANREHMAPTDYDWLKQTPLAAKYGDGLRACAVLCATLPNSRPMLWNGQEQGILSRTPARIPWQDNATTAFYRTLLNAYQRNPALWRGSFARLVSSDDDAVYAFRREADGNRVVVVLNLSTKPREVQVQAGTAAGSYTDVFSGEPQTMAAEQTLALEPWSWRLLVAGTP